MILFVGCLLYLVALVALASGLVWSMVGGSAGNEGARETTRGVMWSTGVFVIALALGLLCVFVWS